MRKVILAIVTAGLTAGAPITAQSPEAFKLGTFEQAGRSFVGVVLRDALVIDFAAGHAAMGGPSRLVAPTDMKDLITRYEQGLRERIQEIVSFVEDAASRPAYVHDLSALRILPPIMYPTTMVNTALNYREHALEMAGLNSGPPALEDGAPPPGTRTANSTGAPGIWEPIPSDERWNPYMFLKSPSTIIANGEAIRLPVGRENIDWECELGAVIGRVASRVQLGDANDYIFGYTIEIDVSDRGGRGDDRYGSDFLIGKSHNTFAPMGPFIVPKEFVGDPRDLAVRYELNGEIMQEATTALMIHDVFEQVTYATNILTLAPGDVIATGSPAGVGSARNPPIFFKPGDISACTYEGIGTLINPVGGPGSQ